MPSVLVLTLLAGLSLIVSACDGGNAAAPTPKGPTEVNVTLSEFKVESSLTNFTKGVPYRFVVTNKGTVNHDFSIATPMMEGMPMTEEEIHKGALVVIDSKDMPPGATKRADVTFKDAVAQRQLEIACYVTGHYEAGMRIPITVN